MFPFSNSKTRKVWRRRWPGGSLNWHETKPNSKQVINKYFIFAWSVCLYVCLMRVVVCLWALYKSFWAVFSIQWNSLCVLLCVYEFKRRSFKPQSQLHCFFLYKHFVVDSDSNSFTSKTHTRSSSKRQVSSLVAVGGRLLGTTQKQHTHNTGSIAPITARSRTGTLAVRLCDWSNHVAESFLRTFSTHLSRTLPILMTLHWQDRQKESFSSPPFRIPP